MRRRSSLSEAARPGARWRVSAVACALVTGVLGLVAPPAPALPNLVPALVGEEGFSDGAAASVGLNPWDLAWDAAAARLLVADCEVVRAVDPAAGTTSTLAIASDLPNPAGLPTFAGRALEVAARPDGRVLVGTTAPDELACGTLAARRVVLLEAAGAASVVAGGGADAPATGVLPRAADVAVTDVAVAADGRVLLAQAGLGAFVVDGAAPLVQVLGGAGAAAQPADGVAAADVAGIAAPRDIAVAADGTLLFARGSQLFAVDAAGIVRERATSLPGGAFGAALAVAPGGEIWSVTDIGAQAVMARTDPATGVTTAVGTGPEVGTYWRALALGAGGAAYTHARSPGSTYEGAGRVLAWHEGAATQSIAGHDDRWQGDAARLGGQRFGLFNWNGEIAGRAEVASGEDGRVRVSGSRIATFDPATGTTETLAEPGAAALWVGRRPSGHDVVLAAQPDFTFRVVDRDPATGTSVELDATPLLAGGMAIDVAADGTVAIADGVADELRTIAPDGTVTRATLALTTGTPASIWALAGGLYVVAGQHLQRRAGTGWDAVADCATGAETFTARVALRDGRFLGTLAVVDPDTGTSTDTAWCLVDPSAATAERVAGPVRQPLPTWSREAPDGSVYYAAYDPTTTRPGIYRLPVAATPATITLRLLTTPAGSPATFTATGAVTGSLSHGDAITGTVPSGTATVHLDAPAGWASTGVVCDDADSGAGPGTGDVDFRVASGDAVTCTIVMAPTTADVSIAKTTDQTSVVAGGTIVYRLSATNHGPGVATDVRLVDLLPPGVRFASAPAGCTHDGAASGGELVCDLGALPADTNATRIVEVTALTPQVIHNVAAATTGSTDPDPTDNVTPPVTTTITAATVNECQAGTGNELWAFGLNWCGQVGVPQPGANLTPQPINLLDQVVQVEGGQSFTVALRANGVVCSWGEGTWLGRPVGATGGFPCPGSRPCTPVPAPVRTTPSLVFPDGILRGATRVVTGAANAFALFDADGDGVATAWGWGFNGEGNVTPGATTPAYLSLATPVVLPGGRTGLRDIATGPSQTIALTADDRVFVWGYDGYRDELGPFPGDQTGKPALDITDRLGLGPGERATRVLRQQRTFLVLTSSDRGICWGDAPCNTNVFGGAPAPNGSWDLGPKVAFTTAVHVRAARAGASGGYNYLLLVDGTGGDSGGDVLVHGYFPGNGSYGPTLVPTRAAIPESATAIAGGYAHNLAIGISGRVWGWGNGYAGELGDGGYPGQVLLPVEIGRFADATVVGAGSAATFVKGRYAEPATAIETVYAVVPATTDGEHDGATVDDVLETTITGYPAGVVINEAPLDPAYALNAFGYQARGQMVSLYTPFTPPPPANPFVVRFALYLSPAERAVEQAGGGIVAGTRVLRNGTAVPDCTEPTAPHALDPCVRSRTFDAATGNAIITVATTRFSTWSFATPTVALDAGGPYAVREGATVRLAGRVTAPDAPTVTWQTRDGAVDSPADPTALLTGGDDGEHLLELTAESDLGTLRGTATVTVANAAPTIEPLTVTPAARVAGSPVSLRVAIADAGRADTHAIRIAWGDATTPTTLTSTTPGASVLTATHAYATARTATITATVTDDDGGTATASTTITIAAPGPVCTITGTSRRDRLIGTERADVICGLGGDDVISGLGGNDQILAGDGNDVVDAGSGNDTVDGANGNDAIAGGTGDDRLLGGNGADWLDGGSGRDACTLGPGGLTSIRCET